MKNYVKNTILFFFCSTLLIGCGEDGNGSKTFSTRGGANSQNSSKTIILNEEQKAEKSLEALETVRVFLVTVLENTSDYVFNNLDEKFNKLDLKRTIVDIKVSEDEETSEQRFEDILSYFKFNDENELVALSSFPAQFAADEYIKDPFGITQNLAVQILSEIHFSSTTGDSVVDYKKSRRWAEDLIKETIGKHNFVCEDADSVLLIHKPTGLAKFITSTSDETSFLNLTTSQDEFVMDVGAKKISALTALGEPTVTELEISIEAQEDRMFSIGDPSSELTSDLAEYQSKEESGKIIKTSISLNDEENMTYKVDINLILNDENPKTKSYINCILVPELIEESEEVSEVSLDDDAGNEEEASPEVIAASMEDEAPITSSPNSAENDHNQEEDSLTYEEEESLTHEEEGTDIVDPDTVVPTSTLNGKDF